MYIIKKIFRIKLGLYALIMSVLVNCQVFAFERETGYSPEVVKEVNKAKTQQEKIDVAKRYLISQDITNKIQAICILRPFGGEAIPVLLDQLKKELQELQSKKVSLDVPFDAETRNIYRSINEIILSLGFTKDRRIIDPLINIIRLNDILPNVRIRAVEVLGIVGSVDPVVVSAFKKQAKPAEGYEVKESDREKIKNILIEMLNDTNPSMRIHAIASLERLKNKDVMPKLESIAKEDKYKKGIDASLRGGEKGEKITIYPVREAAEKALKELDKQRK